MGEAVRYKNKLTRRIKKKGLKDRKEGVIRMIKIKYKLKLMNKYKQ